MAPKVNKRGKKSGKQTAGKRKRANLKRKSKPVQTTGKRTKKGAKKSGKQTTIKRKRTGPSQTADKRTKKKSSTLADEFDKNITLLSLFICVFQRDICFVFLILLCQSLG